MHSAHNEGKSSIAKRFIRKLKKKIYKYMNSVSKNMHFNKLDNIVNKYNNTYNCTNKLDPTDVRLNTYIYSSKEINDKNPEFKFGNNVRISRYENIFAKGYTPNWSEEVFQLNTVPQAYVINNFNGEEIVGTFYDKELQKTNQKEIGIEKIIKKKRDEL